MISLFIAMILAFLTAGYFSAFVTGSEELTFASGIAAFLWGLFIFWVCDATGKFITYYRSKRKLEQALGRKLSLSDIQNLSDDELLALAKKYES